MIGDKKGLLSSPFLFVLFSLSDREDFDISADRGAGGGVGREFIDNLLGFGLGVGAFAAAGLQAGIQGVGVFGQADQHIAGAAAIARSRGTDGIIAADKAVV